MSLHCESCDNSHQCLTCLAPYLLYGTLCLDSCPTGITYPNTLTKLCVDCPDTCAQCTGDYSAVVCTDCIAGYLLDDGACALTCTTPGLVPSSGECVSCSSLCLTCE